MRSTERVPFLPMGSFLAGLEDNFQFLGLNTAAAAEVKAAACVLRAS